MRIPSLITKVSRELSLRCNLKNQPQKLPTFISQSQPWRRRFTTAISENVKVTSREMIKPSSPTPLCNKSVQLSLLDQISPFTYNSLVLFYQNDPHNNMSPTPNSIEQRSKLLKQSLSETLVAFYPLAGRIQGNEMIECNDEGAEFCEAHYSENLLEFIENPNILSLQGLLPFQGEPMHKNILLSIQVSHFTCGGMSIAVCLSHKLTDGAAVVEFLNAWATKAQHSDKAILRRNFNGATFFPPIKQLNETMFNFQSEETTQVRRLIFDKKTIDELKAEAATDRPTTVEVITAFIWKHSPKFSTIVHTVNLRKRMAPAIPDDSYGNLVTFAMIPPMTTTVESPELLIKQAIAKVDNNYIKELYFSENSMLPLNNMGDLYQMMPKDCLIFTSMRRFPVYELNFGIGKPIWACILNPLYKNFVVLMDTKCGQGIEAWVCMHEDDIAMLDSSLSQQACHMVKNVPM